MNSEKTNPSQSVYIAPIDRLKEIKEEVKKISFEKDNFLMSPLAARKSYWAQNIWYDVKTQKIESIAKAASFLKNIQRNWWHFPLNHVRRTKLIQDSLPSIKNLALKFPCSIPTSPLGAFALLSEDEIIYSPNCLSSIPNGEYIFEKPNYETPSEAYLKLWEALTRFGATPQKGDYCIDLGSSPGSWTQALLALGANVLSVDKADLKIPNSSALEYLKKDAFKLDPHEIKNPKWIFSDIICYPEKLYELAQNWRKAHPEANFIFTIKFQGKWDRIFTDKFRQIPNSYVGHLFNNKHELCWISGPSQKL
jgi:23S rRNA (cytidine2498-2'-O)-methyltransferase